MGDHAAIHRSRRCITSPPEILISLLVSSPLPRVTTMLTMLWIFVVALLIKPYVIFSFRVALLCVCKTNPCNYIYSDRVISVTSVVHCVDVA